MCMCTPEIILVIYKKSLRTTRFMQLTTVVLSRIHFPDSFINSFRPHSELLLLLVLHMLEAVCRFILL